MSKYNTLYLLVKYVFACYFFSLKIITGSFQFQVQEKYHHFSFNTKNIFIVLWNCNIWKIAEIVFEEKSLQSKILSSFFSIEKRSWHVSFMKIKKKKRWRKKKRIHWKKEEISINIFWTITNMDFLAWHRTFKFKAKKKKMEKLQWMTEKINKTSWQMRIYIKSNYENRTVISNVAVFGCTTI